MNHSSHEMDCCSGVRAGGRMRSVTGAPARIARRTSASKSKEGRRLSTGRSSGATKWRVPLGPLKLLFPVIRLPLQTTGLHSVNCEVYYRWRPRTGKRFVDAVLEGDQLRCGVPKNR